KTGRVLAAPTVNPLYLEAAGNIVRNQGIALDTLPMSDAGTLDLDALRAVEETPAAIVVQQPNFFGGFEDVDAITDWAAERGALVIAVVNPLTLSVLAPPGDWGTNGADIACGDGQPFGIPMASGGPSFGFICCRKALVRQMPGRIIGRTEDTEGEVGYALTLQAREQHIRRNKATSNICTNQGLLVTAATIHLSLLGAEGLKQAALASAANTRALVAALTAIDGVERRFAGGYFHECVIELPVPVAQVMPALLDAGLLPGVDLGAYHDDMAHCLLVCATEKRTAAEIEAFAAALGAALTEEAA
ncbi:MAG: glycine dehydrogenase, partial [Pseudomonadota bacterium]